MLIHDWILTLEAIREHKDVAIPYQLHDGINKIISAFGGDATSTLEFFLKVEAAECAEIREVSNGETKDSNG